MSPTARPRSSRCLPARRCRSRSRSATFASKAGTDRRRNHRRATRADGSAVGARAARHRRHAVARQRPRTADRQHHRSGAACRRHGARAATARDRSRPGARRPHRASTDSAAGSRADIRRGPIDGKDVSGTLRLETGIGSVSLTDARLSPNGLLRLRDVQWRRASVARRAPGRCAHHGARAERHDQVGHSADAP